MLRAQDKLAGGQRRLITCRLVVGETLGHHMNWPGLMIGQLMIGRLLARFKMRCFHWLGSVKFGMLLLVGDTIIVIVNVR